MDRINSGRMFVTDFDGTLYRSDRTFSATDIEALENLAQMGVVRVIATGRSLYSFRQAAPESLPVDYIVFSTGAGIITFPENRIILESNLTPDEVYRAARILSGFNLDFMVHHPVPENHIFSYWHTGSDNADFLARVKLYQGVCSPIISIEDEFDRAAQLIAILPPGCSESLVSEIRGSLSGYTVIRTTSPLDNCSTWLEIFPDRVSKGQSTAWLAKSLGISRDNVVSVGNDYNDLDLIEWSGTGLVVKNAPAELRKRFKTVSSNDSCGVAEAANILLSSV